MIFLYIFIGINLFGGLLYALGMLISYVHSEPYFNAGKDETLDIYARQGIVLLGLFLVLYIACTLLFTLKLIEDLIKVILSLFNKVLLKIKSFKNIFTRRKTK